MSLFVAGAAKGDIAVSLLLVGAAFHHVGVSLFVAGATCGEIWVASRSATSCTFQYKMRLRSAKSNLGERAGAMLRSCSNGPHNANDISSVLGKFLFNFGMPFCGACGAVFGEVGG